MVAILLRVPQLRNENLRQGATGAGQYRLVPMEVLEFFKEASRNVGKAGGKRRVQATAPEQRGEWARKAAASEWARKKRRRAHS